MYGSQNKWCFVPRCKNTSISAPNKHFLTVPQEYARKVLWFKAARRDVPNSKSMFFCCEDHFNLEQDMENYVRFKLMGGKILLKTGVIPHIFDCQQDRKRAASAPERSLSLKRERKRLVEEAFCSDQPQEALSSDQPSTNSVEVEPEAPIMNSDSSDEEYNPGKDNRTARKSTIATPPTYSTRRRAQTDISEKTTAHVCEDHFNLEEDMDNYVKFKLMGGLKKMKANVVPHIFDCQPDRKRSHTNHPRAAAVKRAKRRIVDESIASSAMTQEQVFNQDDLQIVASSSQTSTISIPPRQAARNASKAISASSFDKSMEKFNPDLSQREKRKLNKKFNQSTVRKPNGAVYDEKVQVTFIKANGEKIQTKGKIGDSLLDVVVNNNIDLDGFGACEGTLTCSTCHLILSKSTYDSLPNKPSDEELDMLDLAYDLCDTSRLGCQIVLTEELAGLEVNVPATINDARS
ncbi:hypothetical protein HUJ05_011905 [Dendroctonus ponderosae]|nr:hypothetical protein HUJ05_011905 [Dendroctonus ponderosae]